MYKLEIIWYHKHSTKTYVEIKEYETEKGMNRARGNLSKNPRVKSIRQVKSVTS